MAIKPVFSKNSASKSSQQYLDELDALLKKNTGRFTNVGSETSSQSPFSVGNIQPGTKLAVTTGVSGFSPIQDNEINTPPVNEVDPNGASSIDSFMKDFSDSIAIYNATPKPIASSQDGGTIYSNGYIRYEDGSYRLGDPNATPIGSSQDGGVIYSDQSVKRTATPIASLEGGYVQYDDGTIQNPNGVLFTQNDYTGIQAISQGLFGGQQAITQPYGNINPIEPTPGNVNYGTDFRTRDLASKDIMFPTGAKVVQIYRDDGTRFGSTSGHQGYGNSVLLQLPTGEMLRLSHLSRIGELQEGQTISPNTYVGTTGATGNVTGEHLDVEYYNQQGQIDNPANFTGFTTPEFHVDPQASQVSSQPTQEPQAPSPVQKPVAPAQTISSAISNFNPVNETVSAINTIKPTGDYGLGLTELASNDPQAAKQEQINTIEKIGTNLNAPELQTNELQAQQNTNPFRQLAGNLVDAGTRALGIKTDLGVSEFLAGGKTTNTDQSLMPQAVAAEENASYNPVKTPDYTKILGENINDAKNYAQDEIKLFGDRAVAKAGEGIQGLKNIGAGIQGGVTNLFDRIKPQNVSGQRMVGENTPGSNAVPVEGMMPGGVQNDIRDEFFKQGGDKTYASYLNQGQVGAGGLSIGLFNDKFYQDPNNIANVFGSTNLVGEATNKYKDYQKSLYSDPEMYDPNEVASYLGSIKPFTTPTATYAPQVKKQLNYTPANYTPASGYTAPKQLNYTPAAAPQMRTISAPVASGSNQNYSPSQPSSTGISSGPKQNYTPAAPKAQNYTPAPAVRNYTPAVQPKQNYTPAQNYSSQNYTPARQSTPAKNTSIFSKAASAIKSIFKR